MKLKICGLKTIEDVNYVNQANVDFAGFVFAPSKQQIAIETARKLKAALNPNIKVVGVFVNESFEFIKSLVDEHIIDVVQFHGDIEFPLNVPTIRAFRMRTADDIIPTTCDYVLFDSYKEGTRGSTGGMFDWRLIKNYDNSKSFFLAGGINIDNIKDAIKLKPYCIDISSGSEDEYGNKSLDKILQLKEVLQNEC